MLSMAYGVWLGLVRLGWRLPLPRPDHLILHGPLMIGGFAGTLIGLERAIGIARPWAFAAPVLTAAGALLLVFGPAIAPGALFVTAGSAVVVGVFLAVVRRESTLFAWTMTAGAAAWLAGNVWWLLGAAIHRVVFFWVAFLVLTIAGERLELNRVRRPSPRVRAAFVAALALFGAGVMLVAMRPAAGVRVTGAGLLALTWWLVRHDVARQTIRMAGVTRYIAVCLLSGYAWLGVAGVLAVVSRVESSGMAYDALLHAIFAGFVLSMIFGHAPIVFPAVLGRPLPFHPAAYAPLVVLHASLAVRIAGDLGEELGRWRAWGALFNAFALLLFVAATIVTIARHAARRSASGRASTSSTS